MRARAVAFAPNWRDGEGKRLGEGRGKGVHLGDILNYRQEQLGLAAVDTGNGWFAQIGFLFERLFGEALAQFFGSDDGALVSPGEQELDGIFMNPDRFHTEDEAVWEIKATWKSMKQMFNVETGEFDAEAFKKNFYRWIWQVASYCVAMGTPRAKIAVLFINGAYTFKPPYGGPQMRVLEIEFDEEELQAHWAAILRDRDDMVRAA
jgi:hypothetical protein